MAIRNDRQRRFAALLADALYVPTCAGCDRRGSWLCGSCAAVVRPIDIPGCSRCGVISGMTCECAPLPPELTRMRSVYPFAGWVREAIHRLKFDGERARAPMLADQFTNIADELVGVDGIVAVPMHPNRQRRRGFNQAELLARRVSEVFGIPVFDILRRVEDRGSQVGRIRQDRWLAIDGVFACTDRLTTRGRRLIVLDDVITTGATVSGCAQELVAAGAAEVRALSVARG